VLATHVNGTTEKPLHRGSISVLYTSNTGLRARGIDAHHGAFSTNRGRVFRAAAPCRAHWRHLLPQDVALMRNGGPISRLLDGLGAGKILRFDVIKDAQMVLNMPRLLKDFGRSEP
jgi:hypothetical protein